MYGNTGAIGGGSYQEAQAPRLGNPPNAPTPVSPIQEAMHRQERAIGELHKTITYLENRLASLCAPSPAAGTPGADAQAPNASHLQRLTEVAGAIEFAGARLNELMSQLQV